MAIQKKPVYTFENGGETGINQVPEARLVHVEDTNRLYIKKQGTTTNQGPSTSVNDAISNGDLVLLWSNESDGPYSGLRAQSATYWGTQNGGQGYRLINVSTNPPSSGDGDVGDIWFQRDA